MKVTKKALVLVLTVAIALSSVCFSAFALGTEDNVAYPFRTGSAALANAPTLVSYTEQASGDTWHWFEAIFDSQTDLSSASYLAVEFEGVKTAWNLTFGIMGGGTRWGSYTDRSVNAYIVTENGTVTERASQNGGYMTINAGEKGMLLLPIANLTKVGWDSVNGSLANSTSLFIETNALYNWNWEITIGEIGYYTGDPANGGTFTKIFDLSGGLKKAKYSAANGLTLNFPGEVDTKVGAQVEYPFTTGAYAFKNATVWAGPTSSDANDNWQTVFAGFDDGAVDLSDATYIAVQYLAKTGAPGLTYGIETANGTRFSNVGHDGDNVYMIGENGIVSKTGSYLYDASNVSTSGALLIPMASISKQFGSDSDLTAMTQLVMTTNSKYNWNFEVGFGEIGYYTGEIGYNDFTYHRLIAFGNVDRSASFAVTPTTGNAGRKYVNKIDRTVYGDSNMFVFGTGKQDGSIVPWSGGAAGTQTIVLDTYGDDAIKLVCDGPREGADAYTAFDMFAGSRDVTAAKGFTLWAKNYSDVEVSFNLEVDCTGIPARAESALPNARFNIKQGNRFWLYDVNTGKQTIYMTRPCVTLPVGFEGWVRIPYSAFAQAEWDAAGFGAVANEDFMSAGTRLTYIGITVYSGDYTGKAFAVNKLGTYNTTPSFISALVPMSDTMKNIPALMGLED